MPVRHRNQSTASRITELTTFVFGLALLIVIISQLPADIFSPKSQSFFFIIGAIAAWRYSWWAVQAARSTWYNRVVFPRLRAEADAVDTDDKPPEQFVLCTSYRI